MTTCTAVTKSGEPCSQPALGSDGLCFFHSSDPAVVEQRVNARRLGGRSAAIAKRAHVLPSLAGPREMLKRLEELFNALINGQASPKQVTAATRLIAEARETYTLLVLEHRIKAVLEQLQTPPYISAVSAGELYEQVDEGAGELPETDRADLGGAETQASSAGVADRVCGC